MIFFSSYLSQNAVIIITILLLFVAVVFSICVFLLIGWFISADCITHCAWAIIKISLTLDP